jgi:flavin reductase (DIM6/NTAB) family NADH-FMN oxidoreductase RutF
MECTLVEEISRKNYSLIIGKVVHLEAEDKFFNEAGEMDYENAQPLSIMLGDRGMWFTRPVYVGKYAEYSEMFLKKE